MWELNESLRRKLSNTASHRLKRRVFLHALELKIMLADLVTILEEPVIKFSNGKTLNTALYTVMFTINGWLFLPQNQSEVQVSKKMIPFASQQWPGVFLYHLEGLLLSRCLGFHLTTISDVVLDVHCSSLKLIYSKFCDN